MAEIYGTTSLQNKLDIRSFGDVLALVRGRRCVVSAMGFEHKTIGGDTRLLAKSLDDDGPLPNTPEASPEVQALIDRVDWPDWPHHATALSP
jgi:hypothetical protein